MWNAWPATIQAKHRSIYNSSLLTEIAIQCLQKCLWISWLGRGRWQKQKGGIGLSEWSTDAIIYLLGTYRPIGWQMDNNDDYTLWSLPTCGWRHTHTSELYTLLVVHTASHKWYSPFTLQVSAPPPRHVYQTVLSQKHLSLCVYYVIKHLWFILLQCASHRLPITAPQPEGFAVSPQISPDLKHHPLSHPRQLCHIFTF